MVASNRKDSAWREKKKKMTSEPVKQASKKSVANEQMEMQGIKFSLFFVFFFFFSASHNARSFVLISFLCRCISRTFLLAVIWRSNSDKSKAFYYGQWATHASYASMSFGTISISFPQFPTAHAKIHPYPSIKYTYDSADNIPRVVCTSSRLIRD